jgi:uncharacterized protein (TIGR02996 family)
MSVGAGAALLDAVYDAPHDDAARLVYADWLLDQGDPRGELIVLQYRTPRTLEQQAREAELLDEHLDEWQGRLAGVTTWALFERGFLARCGLREVPARVIGCREWATVQHVAIDDGDHDVAPLVTHAMMKSLVSLRVPEGTLPALLEADARSPVERLIVGGIIGTNELRGIAGARIFERVDSLVLEDTLPAILMFDPVIKSRFERVECSSRGWDFKYRRGADGRLSELAVAPTRGMAKFPRHDNEVRRVTQMFEALPEDALTVVEVVLPHTNTSGVRYLRAAIARQRRLTRMPTI